MMRRSRSSTDPAGLCRSPDLLGILALSLVAWTAAGTTATGQLPQTADPPEAEGADASPAPPAPEVRLGAPAGLPAVVQPTVEVGPGVWLYEEPSLRSPRLARTDVAMALEILETTAGWVRVRFGVLVGWIPTVSPADGAVGAGRVALRAVPADPERLARALEILGTGAAEPDLSSPYPLYTDIDQRRILRELAGIVGQVGEVYRQRFGLEPGEPLGEAVVVFSREADYRRYADEAPPLPGSRPAGHAGRGIVATYVGDRELPEVYSSLVHELVHLLSRRVFEQELPPWLEEGLADDLGFSRVRPGGRLEPSTLAGEHRVTREVAALPRGVRRTSTRHEISGPLAASTRLVEAHERGDVPPLEVLLSLPWPAFVAPDQVELHYAYAAFLVRFLLDGEGGRYAEPFRRFLKAIEAASATSGDDLGVALEVELETLERQFWGWLGPQAARP